MSTATKTKRKPNVKEFTCARCEVTAAGPRASGAATPPNWVKVNGLYYCLVCRRERAIDAADRAGRADVSTADRAKLRSSAVVDFELARDPGPHRGRDRQGRARLDRRRPQGAQAPPGQGRSSAVLPRSRMRTPRPIGGRWRSRSKMRCATSSSTRAPTCT